MVVYLSISTYRGYLGIHYYGRLGTEKGKDVDVTKPLTATQARLFNEEAGRATYTEGNMTYRLLTRMEVRQRALEIWQDYFPGATLLIEGHSYCAEPQPALAGPPEIVEEIGRLVERAREIGWWDSGHGDEMEELCDRWDEIIGEGKYGRG